MSETIYLPLEHYHQRYRKAFFDMQTVNVARGKLEEQKAIIKEQIAFVKEQQKLIANEFETAEIALRSAIITQATAEVVPDTFSLRGQSPTVSDPGAEGPVDIASLKRYVAESKPGDKAKFVLVDGKLVEVDQVPPIDGPPEGDDGRPEGTA